MVDAWDDWPIYWPTLRQNRSRKRKSQIWTGLQSRLHRFDSGRRLSLWGGESSALTP